ncbi:MAG TPA: M23 family metallopeptidase [Candidatus Angelobacter sp.]
MDGVASPSACGRRQRARAATPSLLRRLFALTFLLASALSIAQQPAWKLAYQPAQLVNGSPVLFRVTAPQRLRTLQATWMEHQISFREGKACKCWYAIAGIDLGVKPGKYPLELNGTTGTGGKIQSSRTVTITPGHYPKTSISLPPQFVEPPKETLQRIEQEQEVKKERFAETSAEALWQGGFEAPTATAVSGVFGSARVVNGTQRNQHKGLDFHAATGTPVHATNGGKVLLARSLYYEGNCVAIDHGQGLITIYMHLSEFKVKEGDQVNKGQLIALSGGTGRANGPHLHFAVRWQGAYLDPSKLLKLAPPANP